MSTWATSLADRQVATIMITTITTIIIILIIIMLPSWGLGQHCVPTPKMAYFSVFKAFLFLKYF